MIASQLVTCEECRDGRCPACVRYKRRRARAKARERARAQIMIQKSKHEWSIRNQLNSRVWVCERCGYRTFMQPDLLILIVDCDQNLVRKILKT